MDELEDLTPEEQVAAHMAVGASLEAAHAIVYNEDVEEIDE